MTDRRVAERPLARAQAVRRRRRWAVAAGLVVGWIFLLVVTRSVLAGTALLVLLVALGAGCAAGLRALGVDVRRPWTGARDYRDLRAVREAGPGQGAAGPGPSGSEPGGGWAERVGGLGDSRDGFRYGDGYLLGHDGYAGAYRGYAAGHDGHTRGYAAGHDGGTGGEAAAAATVATGAPTVAAPRRPQIPMLRLVTGDCVSQTQTSGARAGRGAVDLILPEVPTVSREHARFTFADGEWWVLNLGRNGLMLNGAPLSGAHPLRDGDSIHWGQTPDALLSRVEIG